MDHITDITSNITLKLSQLDTVIVVHQQCMIHMTYINSSS